MKKTYDDIAVWMTEYFTAYNNYAQNPETVRRMEPYFVEDIQFIPYTAVFGGPENAVTNREDFFKMFTGHPFNYERFEVLELTIDPGKMEVVALLDVKLYDTETNDVLVNKYYLPKYYLTVDGNNELKINKVLFFWEACSERKEAAYGVERSAAAVG